MLQETDCLYPDETGNGNTLGPAFMARPLFC
jgi:hypothetical protein